MKFKCGNFIPGIYPLAQRIYNGTEAVPHSIPWQAVVLRKPDYNVLCAAVVISPYHLLTAAHCIEGILYMTSDEFYFIVFTQDIATN